MPKGFPEDGSCQEESKQDFIHLNDAKLAKGRGAIHCEILIINSHKHGFATLRDLCASAVKISQSTPQRRISRLDGAENDFEAFALFPAALMGLGS
jgi:hypothetical protein